MQKIMREQLIEKAASLLNNGTVTAVLGWGKGEFDYDVTPAVFKTEEELKATDKAREIIRQYKQIPCTKCRYCAEVCPKSVPISELFAAYNEYALAHITKKEAARLMSEYEVKATDCIECGACEEICPQNIDIREKLKMLAKIYIA